MYLAEAEELYSKGDLPQAGEKYWGAVTALLNAIAETCGVPHYSHRDYAELVDRLYEETEDRELVVWFRMAEGLYANFYHNFMDKEEF
ncbi:MAG: PaREP1 family protein [Thermofilaceae archaeon]